MKILLVDDHAVVRKGVIDILSGMAPSPVFDEAESSAEALALFSGDPDGFDLVILDIRLPDESGLETLRRIRELSKTLPVLVLSMYDDAQYAIRAFQAGANGYVTKGSVPEDLVFAIEKVMAGQTYASGQLASEVLPAGRRHDAASRHVELSHRETTVLWRLANGERITAIAVDLGLSPKTVATYRSRILFKLDLTNNAELIRYAIEKGLIPDKK